MTIFTSLRGKLLTAFLLLSLVPVIAIAIHGQFFTRAALSDQVLEQSTYQVGLQAENLVASLQQVHGDALYVSSLRSLHQLLDQSAQDGSSADAALWTLEATQDLLVFASVRPMYHGVKYLDSTGREVLAVRSDGRSVSSSPLQDRSGTRYVQQALDLTPGGVFVSSFALDQDISEQGAPYIHYLMKMPTGGGLVQIDLHAGWLLRHLPKNPGRDLWALLDQDGRWLVYPANFDPNTSTVDVSPLITGQNGHHDAPSSVYFFNTIFPVANNPASFWVIVRETPKDELFAGLSYFHGLAMLFIGGATIIAVLLAALTSRWTVGPIIRLKNMAVAFGQTGQPPELPARLSADEIGELTRSFCDMAQELERKRQQEHRLIEQLIRAQEEERKLVAFDLHDGLIQQMVGARFYLSNCREHCPVDAHDARSGIGRGCEALTEAIIEGRRIIEGLRPVVLDDLGLVAAIEELAEQSQRAAGWQLTLNLQTLPTEPEKTVAVTLFRIAQEAFNNIRKHAQAQHVTVTLHNGSGIDLTISDDGAGFDPERVNAEGHGLGVTTMHERAALINGVCTIESQPQAGTRVHVWVPGTVHVPVAAIPGGQVVTA
jgi:signal transduction histidine kinase